MKYLLNEGIRYLNLQQIKAGKNPDLLDLYNTFIKTVRSNLSYGKFFGTQQIFANFAKFASDFSSQFQLQGDVEANNVVMQQYNLGMNAYVDYLLVCVIENGEEPTAVIDINNPTRGKQGKLTEFILKILTSPAWGNRNWQLLIDFIKICQTSSSKLYQSKNMFFDNVVIPFMDDRASVEEGLNYRKLSPVSPLHDKVVTVFNAFGVYNGKNLIQSVMDEVLPEKLEVVKTFAGYDEKLINYCLQKKYWDEIKLPNQPSSIRLFFIGNGNLENVGNKRTFVFDQDACIEEWRNMDDDQKDYWGDIHDFLFYHENEKSPQFNMNKSYDPTTGESDEEAVDEDFFVNSYNFYFTLRALTYACNVYPFKTPYNISKGIVNISSKEISYFSSLSDDDYLVRRNNEKYKIRKTTDWCTKSDEHLRKYILPGETKEVAGFILCLNNSLPYDDPNGAIQMSVIKNRDDNYDIEHSEVMTALDETTNCPSFILNYFRNEIDEANQTISELKTNNPDFAKQKFDDTIDTPEAKKIAFENMLNNKSNINESLLRRYIRYLLS